MVDTDRPLPEVSEELRELIDDLPPENQHILRVLWRDIVGYAVENAERLDEAHRMLRRMLWALAIGLVLLVLTVAATAVSSIVLLRNIGRESTARTEEIQAQRRQSVLGTCQAQNARHRKTVTRFDKKLNALEAAASPARLAQLRQNRAFTVSLIDALAPKQDCNAVVKAALTSGPRATLGPRPRR